MIQWYVARSKPRSEDLLWRQLCTRNVETYYPRVRVPTVNPRARQVQPYFPSYVFVHVDLDVLGRSLLDRIPGGTGLVKYGEEPAPVPDGLIHAIRQRLDRLDTGAKKAYGSFSRGERVTILEGAFAGYEAIFDARLSGVNRVRVLLSMLCSRQIPVDLPAGYLERTKQP